MGAGLGGVSGVTDNTAVEAKPSRSPQSPFIHRPQKSPTSVRLMVDATTSVNTMLAGMFVPMVTALPAALRA